MVSLEQQNLSGLVICCHRVLEWPRVQKAQDSALFREWVRAPCLRRQVQIQYPAALHGSTAADEVTNRFASAQYIAVDNNGESELAKVETWLSLHHSHQAQCVPGYFVSGGSTLLSR